MGALTATVPKPLLVLRGRPIIEHILLGLKHAGVQDATVVTGYRGEQIQARVGSGTALGMRVSYRVQDPPQGTARALLLVRDLMGDEPFVLSWGDIVAEAGNYDTLLREFRRQPSDALLMVNEVDDPWPGAAVYVDESWRVIRLIEKPPRGSSTTRWNNAGIFVLTPLTFEYVERLSPSSRGEYELPQAIAAMVADGRRVRAHPLSGFWSDLGTPQDLAAAEAAYREPHGPSKRDGDTQG